MRRSYSYSFADQIDDLVWYSTGEIKKLEYTKEEEDAHTEILIADYYTRKQIEEENEGRY